MSGHFSNKKKAEDEAIVKEIEISRVTSVEATDAETLEKTTELLHTRHTSIYSLQRNPPIRKLSIHGIAKVSLNELETIMRKVIKRMVKGKDQFRW